MSKLTDLVARMGRQSPQPIGFGALAGTASASPTMALVGRTNAAGAADALAAADANVIDAVLVDFANAEGERVTGTEAMRRLGVKTGVVSRLCREGKLDGEKRGQTWMVSVESINRYALSGVGEALAGTVWGASASGLSGDDADALAAAGCDFFVIGEGEDGAPGAVVSHANAAKLMALSEPVDRETAAALRALGVAGAVNISGVGAGEPAFGDLVKMRRVSASVGGITLIDTRESPPPAKTLATLRDAGADGVVAPLSSPDAIAELARTIREMPPRQRADARGLQAAVVSGG